MIECPDCGARNARNATFCVRCGAELEPADSGSGVGEDTDRLAPVTDAEAPPTASATDADTLSEDTTPESPSSDRDDDGEDSVAEDAEILLRQASSLLASGSPEEAAAKCRDAISIAPDLIAAYSLLGMAEERRGNIVAAAGAYRRVLQLDPDRRVEREKLEALRSSGDISPTARDRTSADDRSPIVRYGPWVAAVGAAFLVLMILTGVGWRIHLQRQAERAFADRMEAGQAALNEGDYDAALQSFQGALALKPDHRDAEQGRRYARRKLAQATGSSRDASAVTRPVPHTANLLPSAGPNPFQPVPIGPTTQEDETQRQEQGRQRAPRPPVVSPERVTGGETEQDTQGQPSPEAVPFGPLEEGEQETTPTGGGTVAESADDQTGETPQRIAAQPEDDTPSDSRGEISIWLSDAPADRDSDGGGTQPPQASTEHSDRAAGLRSRAAQARETGSCGRAADLYDQAIEAYRQDIEENPASRAANEAAIEACERARALCTAEEQ